ncbi:MAG TPA: chemotaxis response regulator protein-glutamate methylesterase [Pseudolabrys sp.]|nr:chemotaxis response regulator protein-glutamate methylesterase [Pseudolabrys sp.]
MTVAVAPASTASASARRIRVLLVDDAVVVRSLLSRWVEAEPDFQLVASLRNGREAVEQIERLDPDVVVLDVDMPELDGISALPLLLQKKRDLVVIMASTLTRRNAEISLRALSLGAADYVPKPDTTSELTSSEAFHRELISKVRQFGSRSKRPVQPAKPLPIAAPLVPAPGKDALAPAQEYKLRPFSLTTPRVLLIGASTGGPQALTTLISRMGNIIDHAPVLITQHMPPTFTTILAEHLSRASGRDAHEARHGEEINAGTVYLAPGGKHMRVHRDAGTATIVLDDGPMVNFCKPAVDPLFSTGAAVWGHWVLALVLTGMGHDGSQGAQDVVAAGGSVIAQDEASSVVWGMPGHAAHAGVCSAVLPLADIGPKLIKLFAGDRT